MALFVFVVLNFLIYTVVDIQHNGRIDGFRMSTSSDSKATSFDSKGLRHTTKKQNIATTADFRYEIMTEHDVEVLHEHLEFKELRGTLFIAHACSHSARDFWRPSSVCSFCVGLSSEVKLRQIAVDMGYLVVAISSKDRRSGCWGGSDNIRVSTVLQRLRSRYDLQHLPLYAYGASSGGSFVANLINHDGIRVDGVMVQIMSINAAALQNVSIPIALTAMPRDNRTATRMRQNAIYLAGKASVQNIVRYQECYPLPVTAAYIHEAVQEISMDHAQWIVYKLMECGHVTSNDRHAHAVQIELPDWNQVHVMLDIQLQGSSTKIPTKWHLFNSLFKSAGYLVKDPTTSDWRRCLLEEGSLRAGGNPIEGIELTAGKSSLAKALHRAWAFHEYCSDYLETTLDWFQSFTSTHA
jgi:hypothetical protein